MQAHAVRPLPPSGLFKFRQISASTLSSAVQLQERGMLIHRSTVMKRPVFAAAQPAWLRRVV
jgi:hypothetical protein